MVAVGLSRLVAASHLSYIVFLLIGGFMAKRWPKLMKWHLGAIGAAAVVNITGSDCPPDGVGEVVPAPSRSGAV